MAMLVPVQFDKNAAADRHLAYGPVHPQAAVLAARMPAPCEAAAVACCCLAAVVCAAIVADESGPLIADKSGPFNGRACVPPSAAVSELAAGPAAAAA